MFWKRLFTNQFIKDLFWSILFILSLYGLTHNPIVRPTPQPVPGNWSIQFMQHPLLFGFAGHNYLSLRDQDGSVVGELHGLATDAQTGNCKYIGSRSTDILQVWEFETGKYYLSQKKFAGIILREGKEEDIRALWEQARSCKDPINAQLIPYPPYGVSIKNETTNSNSVAYTLARCMNLDTRHIGIWTPGSTFDLLAK